MAGHVNGQRGGLTSSEVLRLRAAEGPNLLPQPRRTSAVRQLVSQLTHTLALLLWIAALLSVVAGMPALAVAIAAIVLLNGAFAFWQEYRADRSTQRLEELLPARVRVLRDGVEGTVDAAELVRGDVVMLQAGDRVGADMRIDTSAALRLDESMVTGESAPVPHEREDLLLTGSFVVQGEGTAVVTATGASTALAGIAALAESADRPPSPLTQQLERVVRVVALVATTTGVALGIGSMLLGLDLVEAFLFGVGVTVALVPEGLLPTVTLSLARGAQEMAAQQALVRRLDAVETLGATTFICTDKTGTLTQNRMQVVRVVTPNGAVSITGDGYAPEAELRGTTGALDAVRTAAHAAASCVTGSVRSADAGWVAVGDPMDAALVALSRRCGLPDVTLAVTERAAYSAERLCSGALSGERVAVLGAPERVLAMSAPAGPGIHAALDELTAQGLRVLAVANGSAVPGAAADDLWGVVGRLSLLGLLALEDPPRPGVGAALEACRNADIRVAMLTGDHPATAKAIAAEVGLLGPGGTVLVGGSLPARDDELAEALDRPDGVVVARVTPADKFRIARVLRERGHVVAMTGDGVNDAPALREADVGVAMGASGSDVAREAADLVLLDDHFGTIVSAVTLGRATFQNVRRFLTYHLTDNVAELTPFAVWALTGGSFPLALGVLQVLALDIGTDMLPALGLGAEPPGKRVLQGRHLRTLVDRALLTRAFAVLGTTEALLSMSAFTVVLLQGGWRWGEVPGPQLAATASGTAFAVIAVCQMANAFLCRSTTRPLWRMAPFGNPLVVWAVLAEALLLVLFLGTPVTDLLGGTWPTPDGWLMAGAAAVLLVLVDAASKALTGSTAALSSTSHPGAGSDGPSAPAEASARA